MTLYIILTALAPVGILFFYILHKDKNDPEPAEQLLKAFALGLLSTIASLLISIPLGLLGLYPDVPEGVLGAIATSFFGASIPEEIAKFAMLWLVLRNNKHFDERMDGIVYAVCVSLGFAALENLMYLFGNPEDFLSIGLSRAIFAIPGHFGFGILMGYYYSLARFSPHNQKRNLALTLAAPILAHGIYDSLLFISDVSPLLSAVMTILFLLFCHRLWKLGSKSIEKHLRSDGVI